MSAATVLREAADLIDANEWGQSSVTDTPGAYCPMIALNQINRRTNYEPYEALRRYLGIRNIVAWNDKPGRTKAEVLAAMRGAADALDGGAS